MEEGQVCQRMRQRGLKARRKEKMGHMAQQEQD